MPAAIPAILAGGAIVSSLIGAKSASDASKAQTKASEAGISEQRRQFSEIQKLLAPYIGAGTAAIDRQGVLAGLGDPAQRAKMMKEFETDPMFMSIAKQGESAILQNASATGGLRGGNVQGALAQFRPALLGKFIDQQFAKLSDISHLGQASATGQASAGQSSANAISSLLSEQGAAQAGGSLAQGNAAASGVDRLSQIYMMHKMGAF